MRASKEAYLSASFVLSHKKLLCFPGVSLMQMLIPKLQTVDLHNPKLRYVCSNVPTQDSHPQQEEREGADADTGSSSAPKL